MKHTYHISGMTCNGCRAHVENILSNVKGVTEVAVDLKNAEAIIETKSHIEIEVFKNVLKENNSRYGIHNLGEYDFTVITQEKKEEKNGIGIFYCPMHCEGDKTYNKLIDCPVCGMDLVEEVNLETIISDQYTCPIHPKVIKDKSGTCHICSMDLVPVQKLSVEEKNYKKLLRKFWIAVAFTFPIFVIAMSEMISDNPLYDIVALKYWNWVQFILSIPVVFYATWMFFERAFRSIKTWNLNMFTLIGIGAGVAWGFSILAMLFPGFFPDQFKTEEGTVHVYFEATTVILTFVLLGQLLEARAHKKTNSAVKELMQLAPNKAIRVVGEHEEEITIDQIKLGDILRVKPGDKIPVDGIIIKGHTVIDESMITGEPISVQKTVKDQVSSGTINGNQSFLMKTEKIGADTLLSQIIQMVKDASRSRAPIQKLVDKISGYFVPIVISIAILTFIAWAFYGPEPAYVYALVNAIAVLIIACPCALGLATPMSIMVGVGKGAQNGLLIKNAEALEVMHKVDTLIIDKTGTITEGKPTVETIKTFGNRLDRNKILQYIVSLNVLSEHPLAEATSKYGIANHIKTMEVKKFKAITGKGVEGIIEDKNVLLGNDKMMEYAQALVTNEIKETVQSYQNKGKTVSYLSVNNEIVACVVIHDKIRESSLEVIKELKNKGLDIVMLTGDNHATAQAVANELNLTNFKSEMLPEDKLKEVEKLQDKGKVVAMAGDGINDAPALAKSNVGIAMGTGTNVAIESASITLIKGDLKGIVKTKKLSDKVMKNIKQNLFFALIYNTLGMPIAAGILFPFFGILLSPMIAALAMSFSSVSVIANALRLRSICINK